MQKNTHFFACVIIIMLAHGHMIGKHYNRNQVFNDLNQTRQKFNGTSAQEKNVNFFLVPDRLTLRFRVFPSCFQEWRRCGTHIMYRYYDTHLPNLLSVALPEKKYFFPWMQCEPQKKLTYCSQPESQAQYTMLSFL